MSLNTAGTRQPEKTKILRISLPRTNPNIRDDINAELDNGWHIATSMYLGETADELLIIITKPKRT